VKEDLPTTSHSTWAALLELANLEKDKCKSTKARTNGCLAIGGGWRRKVEDSFDEIDRIDRIGSVSSSC
jgi:hypothetical protein